mmetsp:Transcript_38763/g.94861  ORF Transcript_38763/g.94861 Transcript_38763/m.94861 type:complete len:249 (-) Transcript_38763:38-784(-)
MDELFECVFTPLSSSVTAKLKALCGKCNRYMLFLPYNPRRFYCNNCEETYNLPQCTIKLFKGIRCPFDDFEVVLCTQGEKSYTLCPYCYNHPPLPGMAVGDACNKCTNSRCKLSMAKTSWWACMECDIGTVYLDINSAPKWRLECNCCNFRIELSNMHKVERLKQTCDSCGAAVMRCSAHKNYPFADGSLVHEGCLICNQYLNVRTTQSHARNRRGGGGRGRGRGRGRGGRGRNMSKARREQAKLLRN